MESEDDGIPEAWPCFTDLLIGIIMILILFIFGEFILSAQMIKWKIIEHNQREIKALVKKDEFVSARIDTIWEDGNLQRFVFGENILFDSGRAELKDVGQMVLAKLGGLIWVDEQKNRYQSILVEGHTDTLPMTRGSRFETNWELSSQRAINVAKFLIDSVGVEARRVLPTGRSKFNPIAANIDSIGRARNRRIEIILVYSESISFEVGPKREQGVEHR